MSNHYDPKPSRTPTPPPPLASPTPPSSSASTEDGSIHSRPVSVGPSSRHDDTYEALSRALTGESRRSDAAARGLTHMRTTTSLGSVASRPPDFEVVFDADDPEDPRNWPLWYRTYTLVVLSYSTWVVVLYSTSYTASLPGLEAEFGVDTPTATLGLTTYLLGLAVGSLIAAPLSELCGRYWVYLIAMVVSTLLILPCALADSLVQMIVVRFFGALFASAFIANAPGSVVDVTTEEYRALAMSLWSIAPLNGPVTGPMIGGYIFQYLGWRWDNWIVMILAGVSIAMLLTCRETYAPEILRRKAARLREELDDPRWWSQYDERRSKGQLLLGNMARPFVMSGTEPILWFFNVWISVIYGILYLCFLAYPIVFRQGRGWDSGTSGLAFAGIGIGILGTICCEPLLRRIVHAQPRDPETGAVLPEASAPIMVAGAVLTATGQLGFSWTCLPSSIHWAVPIAFGIPFGAGNSISFIYASNYLASSYGMYAASALAGNTVARSIFGAVLPLAGPKMYTTLTPQWAGTLLGLLEVALIPVPVIFWKFGARIRKRSPAITAMRDEKERGERKRARYIARERRRAEKGAAGEKRVEAGLEAEGEVRDVCNRGSVGVDAEKGASRRGSDAVEQC